MKMRQSIKSLLCLGVRARKDAPDYHSDDGSGKCAQASNSPTQSNDNETTSSANARRENVLGLLEATYTDQTLHDALRLRHENTCDWILDHTIFQEWASKSAGAAKVLWLTGAPGIGKTFLTARIVEHLLGQDSKQVAYFFASKRLSPSETLRSWAAQLILKNDVLGNGAEDLKQLRDSDVWAFLHNVALKLNGVTLIIDGLDESQPVEPRDGQSKFLQKLKESLQNTPARVLVATRDVPDIRGELSPDICGNDLGEGITFHELNVTRDDVSEDLDAYFQKIFEGVVEEVGMTREEFEERLNGKSDGTFSWLFHLQQRTEYSYSLGDLRRRLDGMPCGVDETVGGPWHAVRCG